MTSRLWIVLAAGAFAGPCAHATTVSVRITGTADTSYELTVSGVRRSGRLGAQPGAATVRDLIEVGRHDRVTASLTFLNEAGVVAACPAVTVTLQGSQATCEPAFVLTAEQQGLGRFACSSKCEPRKDAEKSRSGDEDEDEEWYYAGAPSRARPEPRVDGWTQSFYTRAMSLPSGALVYSSPARGSAE